MNNSALALSECEVEPIHIPGAIQPYGVLLVLEESGLQIIQLSENAREVFATPLEQLLGAGLDKLFADEDVARFHKEVVESRLEPPNHLAVILQARRGSEKWTAGVHRSDGVLLVELQRAVTEASSPGNLQTAVRKTIADLDACQTLVSFCQAAADHFREVTGFDRVMIYRFLEDQSGVVVAEARSSESESFVGLRYPASDIPAQARRLYLLSPYRLTADVNAEPAKLEPEFNPKTGRSLDMSYCALRSTSPFHLEYLRNMGVTASASFSIVREGKLWGLVACHHRRANVLSEEARGAGEILTRLLGLQVGIKEEAEGKTYAERLQKTGAELAWRLRDSGDFVHALATGGPDLLTSIDAGGAALCTGSKIVCLGHTPTTVEIGQLRAWLQQRPWQAVWATDHLSELYEPARELTAVASGVLAIQLAAGSPEVVFWFRPELVEVVKWAGNPNDAVSAAPRMGPLGPKRSFELWQEQVRGRSAPWTAAEQAHVSLIRDEMSQTLLRHRALEISRLNAELIRTNGELERFTAVASHDLQEPLRTIALQTEFLFRRVDLTEVPNAQQIVEFVRSATDRMSKLVSSLLEYARTGVRSKLQSPFNVEDSIQIAVENLAARIAESKAELAISAMPTVVGDKTMVSQLMQNLLSNALKYARPGVSPQVSISAQERGNAWLFSVADNGIGFDPSLSDAIFEPFRRLHGRELAGSGLGLAICRRIVESMGGQIWAEGRPGAGATFWFTLQPLGRIDPAQVPPSTSSN